MACPVWPKLVHLTLPGWRRLTNPHWPCLDGILLHPRNCQTLSPPTSPHPDLDPLPPTSRETKRNKSISLLFADRHRPLLSSSDFSNSTVAQLPIDLLPWVRPSPSQWSKRFVAYDPHYILPSSTAFMAVIMSSSPDVSPMAHFLFFFLCSFSVQ